MDATNQFFPTEQKLTKVTRREQSRTLLENVGIHVSRYGLVATLLLIGVLKFTTGEAQGIQPLVASSPLMFWLYKVFSLQAVSNLIGVIEIAVAMLIALRPFSARLSFVGSNLDHSNQIRNGLKAEDFVQPEHRSEEHT